MGGIWGAVEKAVFITAVTPGSFWSFTHMQWQAADSRSSSLLCLTDEQWHYGRSLSQRWGWGICRPFWFSEKVHYRKCLQHCQARLWVCWRKGCVWLAFSQQTRLVLTFFKDCVRLHLMAWHAGQQHVWSYSWDLTCATQSEGHG